MSRKPFIAGNWKNERKSRRSKSIRWSCSIKTSFSWPCWRLVSQLLQLTWQLYLAAAKGSNPKVAAQNTYFENAGPSLVKLAHKFWKKSRTDYVVIGHSERRDYFHETDEDINKKQKQSLWTVCFQSSVVVKPWNLRSWVKQQNS